MSPRSTVGHPLLATSRPAMGGSTRRSSRGWRIAAGVEVAGAAIVALSDWFIPSLVLVGMAALSLIVHRAAPSSLGFRRPARPWRLTTEMLLVAVGLTLLDVGLLMPIADHVSGRHQDVSGFSDIEGNLPVLMGFIVLGWTLAALVEELAFRGYLLTRTVDLLGGSRSGAVASLLLTSILFGAMHTEQGLVGMIVAGIDGLLYGVLRWWKGTLWAPILAHGLVDTIGFVSFFLVGPTVGLW